MTQVTSQTESREKNDWKGESLDDCQKTHKDGADVTWRGSSQTQGEEVSGDRNSSIADVDNLVRWSISDDDDAERRRLIQTALENWCVTNFGENLEQFVKTFVCA